MQIQKNTKGYSPFEDRRSVPISVFFNSFKIKYFYLRRNQRISLRRSIIFSIFDKACTSILLLEVRWLALIKCALPNFRNNTDSSNFSRINLFPSKFKPEVSICIYSLSSSFFNSVTMVYPIFTVALLRSSSLFKNSQTLFQVFD